MISDELSIVNEEIATELKTIGKRQIGEPAAPIDERSDRGSSASDDPHELSGISSAAGYDPSTRTIKRTLHVKTTDAESPKRTVGELSFEEYDRALGLRPGASRDRYIFERQGIIDLNRQHAEREEELRSKAERRRATDIAARREYEEGAPEWGALSGRTRSRIAGVTKAAGGVWAILGSELTLGTSAVVGADWLQAGLRQAVLGDESSTAIRSVAEFTSEASGKSVREAKVHGDLAEIVIDATSAGWAIGRSATRAPTGLLPHVGAAPPQTRTRAGVEQAPSVPDGSVGAMRTPPAPTRPRRTVTDLRTDPLSAPNGVKASGDVAAASTIKGTAHQRMLAELGQKRASAKADAAAPELKGKAVSVTVQDVNRELGVYKVSRPTVAGERQILKNQAAATPKQMDEHLRKIGHEPTPAGPLDQLKKGGFPGKWQSTHAEKQQMALNAGRSTGVNLAMCDDCVRAYQRQAVSLQETQVISDPNGTWVFEPDGTITQHFGDGLWFRTRSGWPSRD